jgi:hypothetical protein
MEFAGIRKLMKSFGILGILLAVPRVFALVCQRFTYTRQKKAVAIGPIHATADSREHVLLPPIVGGLALAAGAVLLVMGARQKPWKGRSLLLFSTN